MSEDDLKKKVDIAQAAVKDLDENLKESAFKIILEKLLSSEPPHQRRTKKEQPVQKRQREKAGTPTSVAPIPLNLKGGKDSPPLRKFYKEKSPASNQEKVTVFVYYLAKFLGIQNILPGHIITCYNEVGERKPLQIVQLFRDIKHRKGWLDVGDEQNSVRISISGENLVEHDLPGPKSENQPD